MNRRIHQPLPKLKRPRVDAKRGVKMGGRERDCPGDLGLLIGAMDLVPLGPLHLLGTPERRVHCLCVLREHASVAVYRRRGNADLPRRAHAIERQPEEPRHLRHLVLPLRHRAARRVGVVVQLEEHASAVISGAIGRHRDGLGATRRVSSAARARPILSLASSAPP